MDRRKFIYLAGSGAALMSSGGGWVACSKSLGNDFEKQLKDWSVLAFKRFKEVWDFNDFWKRGNTFDACLTFLLAVQERWPDDPEVAEIQSSVVNMLRENLVFFNRFDPGFPMGRRFWLVGAYGA
jgi:hypothetical protein